jgi:hypothetical protein
MERSGAPTRQATNANSNEHWRAPAVSKTPFPLLFSFFHQMPPPSITTPPKGGLNTAAHTPSQFNGSDGDSSYVVGASACDDDEMTTTMAKDEDYSRQMEGEGQGKEGKRMLLLCCREDMWKRE